MSKQEIYLIDGHAYMYRSFYAIRELSNSKGEATNALYGFTAMLMKLLRTKKPKYLAVIFDPPGPTVRDEKFEEYKAQRDPMPDTLIPQMERIKDVLEAFAIPVFEVAGYEGDDALASLAVAAKKQGLHTYIMTSDKDMLQLVDEDIQVMSIHKDGYIYDEAKVKEKMGVEPKYIADLLGMAGDSADNIPGVPGVGVKTAAQLINEWGAVEEILKHTAEIKSPARRKKMEEHQEQALLSKDLATLITDVPGCTDALSCLYEGPNVLELKNQFKDLEFRKFLQEASSWEGAEGVQEEDSVRGSGDQDREMTDLQMVELREEKPASLSQWLSNLASDAQVTLWVFEQTLWCKLRNEAKVCVFEQLSFEEWQTFWKSPVEKVLYDAKGLLRETSLEGLKYGALCDVMLLAYLLNPGRTHYPIDAMCLEQLQQEWLTKDECPFVPENLIYMEAMAETLKAQIGKMGLKDLWQDIEQPLIAVLSAMEQEGICIDQGLLANLSQAMEQNLAELTEKIYAEAGEEFNINSPKQLAEILFEKLKLPKGKKTKTGYSTNVDVLEKLAKDYDLPKWLLEYRKFHKLKSTYIDALPKLVDSKTNRVHTHFNQTGTATGRLSSTDPNLQNIPIRLEIGKEIRKAFVPGHKDWKIVSADYSQVELRVLAHLCKDEQMKACFTEDVDIHQRTAASIMGVMEELVTEEMRRMAKAVNFSLIYGKTPFGLSKDLGISVGQAHEFIEAYFENFPKVRDYINLTIAEAKDNGFVKTLFGRLRYLPDINNRNKNLREFAERMAMNTPVQGTAADLMKMAMIKVQTHLQDKGYQAKLLLQIHDELLLECPPEELSQLSADLQNIMETCVSWDVPLKVNLSSGANWAEAH